LLPIYDIAEILIGYIDVHAFQIEIGLSLNRINKFALSRIRCFSSVGIAKAVNDNKTAQHQLEKLQRHNHAMEDRSVYLIPYKRKVSNVEKKSR